MDTESMAAAAKAVSGPNTPDAIASTSRPDRLLTVAMACCGPVITAVLALIILLLADSPRWPPSSEALARVGGLRDIGMALCLCLTITVLRLASGAFKSGTVKAGPASDGLLDHPMTAPPALANPAAFFDVLRAGKFLGPTLSLSEVSGCEAIVDACDKARWPVGWTAYALATAWLETANAMQAVVENGGAAYFRRRYDIQGLRPDKARELGNLRPGDGALYCGRGLVQITGKANYERLDRALGLGGLLVNQPDIALQSDVAADVMVCGMGEGLFTGKKLLDYLPAAGRATVEQFRAARRVINGTDRADEIAAAAVHFQKALIAGGWG